MIAADVAGETVTVHPQGGMVSFPVFSVSGEIADSSLRHDVCNDPQGQVAHKLHNKLLDIFYYTYLSDSFRYDSLRL